MSFDATTLEEIAKGLGDKGLASLKDKMGKAWDSLTEQERKDAAQLLVVIGKVRLAEIAGKDVSDHLPILEAALLQWRAVASGDLAQALKGVALDIVGTLGTSALSFVIKR